MTQTKWWTYVLSVIGDMQPSKAADQAGFDKSAMTRWKNGGSADPYFVVKFARGFRRNVIEALVESGLITEQEAALRELRVGSDEALESASDNALILEVQKRILTDPIVVSRPREKGDVSRTSETQPTQTDREVRDELSDQRARREPTDSGAIAADDQE